MGGVARRATKINEVHAEVDGVVLTLDAGNSLFGQTVARDSEGVVIVDAMNAMRYDAMGVGGVDLAQGVETLLARAADADFAIVSCNLADPATGELLLPPYTVIERDGLRVGIIGVSDIRAFGAPDASALVTVLEPVGSVRRHMPEVQAQSDLIVVLSTLGLESDEALAAAVPEVDLIVGGRTRKILQPPVVVGDTVIVQMGYDGQRLGRLDALLDTEGLLREPEVTILSLGPMVPDDAGLAALVSAYKERFPPPPVPSH